MKARWRVASFSLALAGLCAAPAAGDSFEAQNVTLLANVPFEAFSTDPHRASDCWGYVSASGREYALVGLFAAVGVVEITNPTSPVIVAEIPHTGSNWCDIKVHGDYAYAVNEGGGGLDVIDLSQADSGIVTLVQRVTEGGLERSHNVAIDSAGGYLYLAGSNLSQGRLVAFDLSNPANPTLAGQMDSVQGDYVHDAQIVTFTSGPYAGRQICYASVGAFGLDIYDVTDKGNMFRLSRTPYPNLSYAHQAWLTDDRQYLYLNDELDGVNETVIFDVSDIDAPVVVGAYDSGTPAGDHNVYWHEGFIYEAEYNAGLRIFDATDPLAPVQVGWIDTYPEDDGNFQGAWSVFPFFPSGNVIISDKDRCLFVVRPGPAPVAFTYPDGLPQVVGPVAPAFTVEISGQDGFALDPASPALHADSGSGFVETPLVHMGGSTYAADFGRIDCASPLTYYVSAATTSGIELADPISAPCDAYFAVAGLDATTAVDHDMETDEGWLVGAAGDSATFGVWERVDPNGTAVAPEDDHTPDPGTDCYVTGQGVPMGSIGADDVDGGATTLRSPLFDLSGADDAVVSFWLWYDTSFQQIDADEGSAPSEDVFVVDVSNDHGSSWTNAVTVGPGGEAAAGGWRHYAFRLGDLVTPTAQVFVRFVASDVGLPSVVEAGVDDFTIELVTCAAPGDVDGDGDVDIADLLELLAEWGACPLPCPPSCATDLDGDCQTAIGDLLMLLASWTG